MNQKLKKQLLKKLAPEPWKKDLAELILRADASGKSLFQKSYCLTFTPEQLAKAAIEGRFIWGVVNWELRDPAEGWGAGPVRRWGSDSDGGAFGEGALFKRLFMEVATAFYNGGEGAQDDPIKVCEEIVTWMRYNPDIGY